MSNKQTNIHEILQQQEALYAASHNAAIDAELELGSRIDDLIEDLNYGGKTRWSIDYGRGVGILRSSKGFELFAPLADILTRLETLAQGSK